MTFKGQDPTTMHRAKNAIVQSATPQLTEQHSGTQQPEKRKRLKPLHLH